MLCCLLGCGSSARDVSILVSGDTAGWITPCECAANQSGGLARRATVIQEIAKHDEVVLLDAGGSATGTNEYHRLKLLSILRGLNQMNNFVTRQVTETPGVLSTLPNLRPLLV